VYAYDGNLKLGLLPASIFCSGHTYFIQSMYQQFRLEPYAVHTTFQYAGTPGKRHRLREAMLFYDPPEYYNSSGKLAEPYCKARETDDESICSSFCFLLFHLLKLIKWPATMLKIEMLLMERGTLALLRCVWRYDEQK
ncbi:Arabinosyltransferase XEG113-like protein, partial [Drosera capensis]